MHTVVDLSELQRHVSTVSQAATATVIQRIQKQLKRMIEPDVLLRNLPQSQTWIDESDVYQQANCLIGMFGKKSDDECQLFLKVLEETDQQHVANFVRNNGREYSYTCKNCFLTQARKLCKVHVLAR